MTTAEIVDIVFHVFACVMPVLCVLRWGYGGAVLGGVVAWLAIFTDRRFLYVLDPEWAQDSGLGDDLWLLFGLFPCLIYSLLIYGAVGFFRWLRARWKRLNGR